MTFLLTFIILASLSFVLTVLMIGGTDRRWITRVVLVGWFCLFPILALVNGWLPFAGGGDDESYFYLAAESFRSLVEVFDLTKFVGLMEQAGYPWLLSIMYQFTGQDLLSFKLLNLGLFIMLIPMWY